MSRLDQLDLSLKLSAGEESARLEAAQKRLLALRLALGGQVGDHEIGPPVLVIFEGWDARGKGGGVKRLAAGGGGRERQGRRDQAARGGARPAPRASRAVRGADLRREAPPLAVALLAGPARLG